MNLQEQITKAKIAIQEQQFDQAIDLLTAALAVYPDNPNLYSERGVAHFHAKHNLKALADMDKAVELEPLNSYRYSSRAFVKGACRMTQEAIADYEKCIELDPEDSIAYNNLGLLQEQLGWQKQAEDNFDKADTLEGVLKDRKIAIPESEQKTAEDKTQERTKESAKAEKSIEDVEEITPTKMEVAKAVFTQKSVFKEFIEFIKNGFKLKE
ncbi:MAG: tetratricopeptide repeat protein [Flavobacteriales bacterium]|jgi:tetratricopeptide (TPR) repeat protein|nr:tetratricopeptide repeat protein [Flavobacteriales bacterium]